MPKLRHELQIAGLPPQAIEGVVAGFRVCYHDIAHAKDPTQTPASCERMNAGSDAQSAAAVRTAVDKVRPQVQRRDFSDSLVPSLWSQIAVFAGDVPAGVLPAAQDQRRDARPLTRAATRAPTTEADP